MAAVITTAAAMGSTRRHSGRTDGDETAARGPFGIEHAIEGQSHVRDVVQPVLRVPDEAAHQKRSDRRREFRRKAAPVDVGTQHVGQCLLDVGGLKCASPGQHLVEHAAKRPHVAAFVHFPALDLLWAHVGGCSQNHSHLRHGGTGQRGRHRRGRRNGRRSRRLERLSQPEVEHLHGAVGTYLHVCGLQVAVDDALFVSGLERLDNLPGDGDGFGNRESVPRRGDRRASDPRPAPSPEPCRRRRPPLRRWRRCSGG